MSRLWAKVYNAAGTLQGSGPVDTVTGLTLSRVLDGPGDIQAQFPLASKRVQDLIDNERRLQWFTSHREQTLYTGETRNLGTQIARRVTGSDGGSNTLTVGGPDQLEELRRINLWLAWEKDNVLLSTVIDDLESEASGWTFTQVSIPLRYVTARFDGVSVLKALQEICARYGLHFRWADDREIDIGVLEDDAPVALVQATLVTAALLANDDVAVIEAPQWEDNTEGVVNRILPVGGGAGEAALTLEHSTRGQDYYATVEAYNTGKDIGVVLQGGGSKEKLAQSFELDSPKWVKAVRLLLHRKNSPTGTLTLRIETDNSGEPSGTLIDASATATFDEADVGKFTWHRFVFSGGFYLDSGTTYWLVLSTDRGMSTTNNIRWGADSSSPAYTDGEMLSYASSTWSAESKDALFEVETEVTSLTSDVIAEHDSSNRDSVKALMWSQSSGAADVSGATITATKEHFASPVEDAFDGDLETDWSTGEEGDPDADCEIDNSPTTIEAIGYRIYGNLAEWNLYYWDGATYQLQDAQSGVSSAGAWYEVLFGASRTADQWKLEVLDTITGSQLRVYEFQLIVQGEHEKLAQSFQTGSDAVRVKQVDLWLAKKNSPTGNLSVRIETDSGGSPSGTAVAVGSTSSGTVAASGLGITMQKVTFTFAKPPALDASTTYWIVLSTTDGAHASNYVLWYADSDGGFANGTLKTYDGSVWSATGMDGIFRVMAEADVHPYTIQSTTVNGQTIYYLEDSASVTAYGAIERVLKVKVSPLGHSERAVEMAADALYDASATWLTRHKDKQTLYRLPLRKAVQTILPGQKVPVRYSGMVTDREGNEIAWRDINGKLWVTAVQEQIGPDGAQMMIDVSTVDRPSKDVVDDLIEAVEAVQLDSVFTQPYPAVFTYTVYDFAQAVISHVRYSVGGTIVVGKNAQAVLTPNPAIMQISRIIMRVKTYPLYTLGLFDKFTVASEGDVIGYHAVIEDDRYPASISIAVDGVNKDASLLEENELTNGPWLTDQDQNEQWDAVFDVTDVVLTGGATNIFEPVLFEISCGLRNNSSGGTLQISTFSGLPYGSGSSEPTGGLFQITFEVHAVTQAVKTS